MRWIGSADFHPNAERLKRGAKVHLCAGMRFQPLLKSEWAVWRVEGGREPGAANP
jgi:hypothetical protein